MLANVLPRKSPASFNNGCLSVLQTLLLSKLFPSSRLAWPQPKPKLLLALLPQHVRAQPLLQHDPALLKHLFEVNHPRRKPPSIQLHFWWSNPILRRTNGSLTTRSRSSPNHNWTLGSRTSRWTQPNVKSLRRIWSRPKIGGINNPTPPTAPLNELRSTWEYPRKLSPDPTRRTPNGMCSSRFWRPPYPWRIDSVPLYVAGCHTNSFCNTCHFVIPWFSLWLFLLIVHLHWVHISFFIFALRKPDWWCCMLFIHRRPLRNLRLFFKEFARIRDFGVATAKLMPFLLLHFSEPALRTCGSATTPIFFRSSTLDLRSNPFWIANTTGIANSFNFVMIVWYFLKLLYVIGNKMTTFSTESHSNQYRPTQFPCIRTGSHSRMATST